MTDSDMRTDHPSVLVIGYGRMGSAVGSAIAGRQTVFAFDPLAVPPDGVERLEALTDPCLPEALTIIIAVKPQSFQELAPALASLTGPDRCFVSIMAGISLDRLGSALGNRTPIIRTMPNIAATTGYGVTAALVNGAVTPAQRAHADALMATLGEVVWLEDEEHFDVVTALSGSGPAYFYRLTEALTLAAWQCGLPLPIATQLARQTFVGAARFAEVDAAPIGTLRAQVTSPGGTTAAGLAELDRDRVIDLLCEKAIKAAASRSRELAAM